MAYWPTNSARRIAWCVAFTPILIAGVGQSPTAAGYCDANDEYGARAGTLADAAFGGYSGGEFSCLALINGRG